MSEVKTKSENKSNNNPVRRIFLLVSGILSALLGFAGIFLPLLPTTPFLLLASWCFVRSSDKMNDLLMNNRVLGPYISNYKSGKGITLRNKIYSLIFLWVTISTSIIFSYPRWWLLAGLIGIGTIITVHILRFKTIKS